MGTTPNGGAWRANYVLAVLFGVNVLNLIDRSILGIVLDPVKHDLALTDSEMGLVSGLAFVLFHLIVGLFIARWVDRGNRRLILTCGIALWSLATGLTGLVDGFYSLAATRMLVGVGEATAFPVAMSLIGDYFAAPKRPRSVAIFQTSNFVGIVVGSIMAGVIAQSYGWRAVFFACGLAGLAFVTLVLLTVREPRRGVQEGHDAVPPADRMATLPAIAGLSRTPGFLWLATGFAVSGMSVAVLPVWAPALFLRSHGISLENVGAVIGPPVGIGGISGTLLSGLLAGWLVRRRQQDRAGLFVPMIALPLAAPCFAVFIFCHDFSVAMIAVGFGNFFLASSLGPCIALAIGIVPLHLRGLGSTMMLIAQGIIGGAAAPWLVGVISDGLTPRFGQEALRHALSMIVVTPLIAPIILLLAYRQLRPVAKG